jgi:hypothetical protein
VGLARGFCTTVFSFVRVLYFVFCVRVMFCVHAVCGFRLGFCCLFVLVVGLACIFLAYFSGVCFEFEEALQGKGFRRF